MHAPMIEALPARALGILAVAGEIGFAAILIEDVVFARRIEHRDPRLFDDLVGDIELLILGEMRDIARMDHEGGLGWQSLDLGESFAKRAGGVRIGGFAEADMAVANL